jgi:hypothetical protein
MARMKSQVFVKSQILKHIRSVTEGNIPDNIPFLQKGMSLIYGVCGKFRKSSYG